MLNQVALMGRLTADPELRHTTTNIPVVSFTLAVDRRFARQGEEKQTDFINIVAWRQTAEFVARFFKKGMQVAVTGRIQSRNWKDNNGNTRYATEVVVDNAYFADSRRDQAAPAGDAPFAQYQAPAAAPSSGGFDAADADFSPIISDEELPF